MSRLVVKKFGPIDHLDIQIKDTNIFIGTTGSGKSTAAKLIALFQCEEFLETQTFEAFNEMLGVFNIEFELSPATEITFHHNSYYWRITKYILDTDFPVTGKLATAVLSYSQTLIEFKNLFGTTLSLGTYIAFLDLEIEEVQKSIEIIEKKNPNSPLKEALKKIIELRTSNKLDSLDENTQAIAHAMQSLSKNISKEYQLNEVVYIPAERILLSMISEGIHSMIKGGITLAKCYIDFAAHFEAARKEKNNLEIPFLGIHFKYENNINWVTLRDGNKVRLEQASSGIQSIIPMMHVMQHKPKHSFLKHLFVVEEPELNLYPTSQKEITQSIIQSTQLNNDTLVITTHSPYVLSTIDNLIVANNTALSKPDRAKEVEAVVPKDCWVDFEKVSCYYFDKGEVKDILDYELKTIMGNAIDDVSEEIAEIHGKLLSIQYN